MAVPNKGFKHSLDTKHKMSLSRKGKTKTAEWKRKIKESNQNKQNGIDHIPEDVRKIINEKIKGKSGKYKRTPEILQKMRAALKGRKHSAESNKKRSETLKRKIAAGEIIREPENPSRPEIEFGKQIFKHFGINLSPSKWLEKRCFDYCHEPKKLLFECDGSYWHSLPERIVVDKLKNEIAIKHHYTLIRYSFDYVKDVEIFILQNYESIKKLLHKV